MPRTKRLNLFLADAHLDLCYPCFDAKILKLLSFNIEAMRLWFFLMQTHFSPVLGVRPRSSVNLFTFWIGMISAKYQRLVFAFFMSLLMSFLMSGIITFINLGWVSDFFVLWMDAYWKAFVIAFPTIFVVAPIVQKLTAKLIIQEPQ